MSNNKRKKSYYNQSTKKTRYSKLEPGMRGFIITCNNREREAIKEGYNLLNEYAETLYGPDNIESNNDDANDDMDAALKKEVESLKVNKNIYRFTNVKSCTNNCLFIKTTCEDPNEIVHAIYDDVITNKIKKSRFIMRLVPVLETCSVSVEKMVSIVVEKYDKYFGAALGGISFKLQIKIRNNNNIKKDDIIEPLVDAILKLGPMNSVNLDTPQRTLNIDVLQRVCCIGVLFDQVKYAKYNLEVLQSNVCDPEKITDECENVVKDDSEAAKKDDIVNSGDSVKKEDNNDVCDPVKKEDNNDVCDPVKEEDIIDTGDAVKKDD